MTEAVPRAAHGLLPEHRQELAAGRAQHRPVEQRDVARAARSGLPEADHGPDRTDATLHGTRAHTGRERLVVLLLGVARAHRCRVVTAADRIRATLDPTVKWLDLMAVAAVAGVGFTVSLLIGELSFGADSPHSEHVKAAILFGSLGAAGLGGVLLTWRSRVHVRAHDLRPSEVSDDEYVIDDFD